MDSKPNKNSSVVEIALLFLGVFFVCDFAIFVCNAINQIYKNSGTVKFALTFIRFEKANLIKTAELVNLLTFGDSRLNKSRSIVKDA